MSVVLTNLAIAPETLNAECGGHSLNDPVGKVIWSYLSPFELVCLPANTYTSPVPLTPFLNWIDMIRKWISGPDPHLHRLYVQFGYHRVSARLRGEHWDLPWETWRDIWLPNWEFRGRGANDLCLARIDMDGPWHESNIHLLTRREHSRLIREHHR